MKINMVMVKQISQTFSPGFLNLNASALDYQVVTQLCTIVLGPSFVSHIDFLMVFWFTLSRSWFKRISDLSRGENLKLFKRIRSVLSQKRNISWFLRRPRLALPANLAGRKLLMDYLARSQVIWALFSQLSRGREREIFSYQSPSLPRNCWLDHRHQNTLALLEFLHKNFTYTDQTQDIW